MEANNEDLMQYSFGNLYFVIVLCRCRIGACDPCNCQPGDYCRRFGGAHSLLSFLEVNYAGCFIFHLGFGDGRLRRSCDYRARCSAGVSD